MCYHVNRPDKANLSTILKPDIEILPYPELEFANGFAKPEMPVLKNDNFNAITPWPWSGFIPPTDKFKYTTLNARCETVFRSSLYGESAKLRRCLMFIQGMYEWSPGPENKVVDKDPYYIDRLDRQPFAVAGIWKDWGIYNDKPHRSMSIITTPANELLLSLRPDPPRMLLILDKNKWDQWLDPKASERDLTELFQTYPDGYLEEHLLAKSPLKK